MKVLVVEDERKIAGFLQRGLGDEGHQVEIAGELSLARAALTDHGFDLILVDRMLPDGDGLDLIRQLRRAGDSTPAICLTARDRIEEKVTGLQGGADDYLVKPFSFEELLARIEAVLRRSRTEPELKVGDLRIDVPARRVFRGAVEIRLTAREFDLLRFLVERKGQVISRTRLLEAVWDTSHDPGTNSVDVYISYLRSKIDKGFDPPLVHTLRGVGYVVEDKKR